MIVVLYWFRFLGDEAAKIVFCITIAGGRYVT